MEITFINTYFHLFIYETFTNVLKEIKFHLERPFLDLKLRRKANGKLYFCSIINWIWKQAGRTYADFLHSPSDYIVLTKQAPSVRPLKLFMIQMNLSSWLLLIPSHEASSNRWLKQTCRFKPANWKWFK